MIKKLSSLALSAALGLTVLSSVANAQSACVDLFKATSGLTVDQVVVPDGYKQWLLWEQLANVPQYRKPTTPIQVPLAILSPDAVRVETTDEAPQALINAFRTKDGKILWAQHPYNTSSKVPYKDLPAETSIPAYMTASRSLALDGPLRGFTIKLGTNYPHGPNGERQEGKTKTNDDIDSALVHTNHIRKVDHVMGADDKFILLGEIMTVAEVKTGVGMVVRDVRMLADGHYYLPALSIPYAGRDIAKLNGESFESFFKKNYAQLLGEAKARLLLRYGLQMLTPNSQNMLIQFDKNMVPTGKIVFRDISDAYLVDAVATGLGYTGQIKRDNAIEYPPETRLNPFWSNSSWRFDEAPGDANVSSATVNDWGLAHNTAYIQYIEKELGMKFNVDARSLGADEFPQIYKALQTAEGQQKLREYRDRMVREERTRRAEEDGWDGDISSDLQKLIN